MDIVEFVDSIAASPTVRLSLTSGPWRVLHAGTDLSPPALRRASASTLMRDGAFYPAAAYDDRILKLRFGLSASTADSQATSLQQLQWELDRPGNLLRWQPHGATFPVFFRTIRSATGTILGHPGANQAPYREIDVELLAEPFAYGLKQTISTATVSNNPAAGSNGCFMDITGVKGDVETPLIIRTSTTNIVGSNDNESLFAVRRRGTPSNAPFLLQAESMTVSTDTTTQANDAAFSGAGNNYTRTTFATQPGLTTRLATTHPAGASQDYRGTYRVFARVRKTVSGDTVNVQLTWGGTLGTVTNDLVTLPAGTTIHHVDLGLMSMPPGPDPVTDGLSGTALSVTGVHVRFRAERAVGTGAQVDLDYLLFVPADDRLCVVKWGTLSGSDSCTVDGTRDMVYGTVSGAVNNVNIAQVEGGFPMVTPNQTNRLYFVRQVRAGAITDTIGGTNDLDVSYFPRYLYLRPAST